MVFSCHPVYCFNHPVLPAAAERDSRCSIVSECYIKTSHTVLNMEYLFLPRVSTLMRDIDIANLSVTFLYSMKTSEHIVIVFIHHTVAQYF